MKVKFSIPKKNYNANDIELTVIYDNNIGLVNRVDRYGLLSEKEAYEYTEIYNKDHHLTPKEYDSNVDIVDQIYKEMVSAKNLKKAILTFPKDYRGYFKRSIMTVCKSMNVIESKDSFGFKCNELKFKFINYKTIELQYGESHFIV